MRNNFVAAFLIVYIQTQIGFPYTLIGAEAAPDIDMNASAPVRSDEPGARQQVDRVRIYAKTINYLRIANVVRNQLHPGLKATNRCVGQDFVFLYEVDAAVDQLLGHIKQVMRRDSGFRLDDASEERSICHTGKLPHTREA